MRDEAHFASDWGGRNWSLRPAWIGVIGISCCNALGVDLPDGGLQGRLVPRLRELLASD